MIECELRGISISFRRSPIYSASDSLLIGKRCGSPGAIGYLFAHRPSTRLIHSTRFGVPTIAVEKELFWGYDMTDMAIAYLRDPLAFEDTEMQRMSNLPIGVERC